MIGFTGTREGMTPLQVQTVRRALEKCVVRFGQIVLHGDCLGADAQFDEIATGLGCERRIYPCDIQSMRAHCERIGAIEAKLPAPPLTRNSWIIEDSLALIATPKAYREELRSGTWSTIRRARKRVPSIPLIIVLPDGSLFV